MSRHSKHLRTDVQSRTRNRPDRRLSRGDVAQAHPPDARAPAATRWRTIRTASGSSAACGADLPQLRKDLDKYLNDQIEQFSRGQHKEPEQTLAFRRVLQTAVLHVQSAGRQEVQSGDVLAATLQQNRSYAAQLLAAQGVTRLDILEYITHGVSKVPPSSTSVPTPAVTIRRRLKPGSANAAARRPAIR